ncbi:MAG: hypothetical protein AAF997_24220 [Myxococcota bacterium]
MVKRRSELGLKGTCPCVGVLCFLVALFAGLFTSQDASADSPGPATAIKGTPLVVPAAVLGVSNPYLVRAALPSPTDRKSFLSAQILGLAERADRLARDGLHLNRRSTGKEKLHLRFDSRMSGGALSLCYRH